MCNSATPRLVRSLRGAEINRGNTVLCCLLLFKLSYTSGHINESDVCSERRLNEFLNLCWSQQTIPFWIIRSVVSIWKHPENRSFAAFDEKMTRKSIFTDVQRFTVVRVIEQLGLKRSPYISSRNRMKILTKMVSAFLNGIGL